MFVSTCRVKGLGWDWDGLEFEAWVLRLGLTAAGVRVLGSGITKCQFFNLKPKAYRSPSKTQSPIHSKPNTLNPKP